MTFALSQPGPIFTHCSPGDLQSLEIKGISLKIKEIGDRKFRDLWNWLDVCKLYNLWLTNYVLYKIIFLKISHTTTHTSQQWLHCSHKFWFRNTHAIFKCRSLPLLTECKWYSVMRNKCYFLKSLLNYDKSRAL